jgi:hypothetical protein
MYIGETKANSQASSATAALGEIRPLSSDALNRAVTLNRVYARTVGWMDFSPQIAILLGITSKNPDIWSFVQALANWQARNGMMPNGILGPGEWYAMQTANRRA